MTEKLKPANLMLQEIERGRRVCRMKCMRPDSNGSACGCCQRRFALASGEIGPVQERPAAVRTYTLRELIFCQVFIAAVAVIYLVFAFLSRN